MKWKKIAGGIFVIALFVIAFWYGGNTPDNRGFSVQESTEMVQQNKDSVKKNTHLDDNREGTATTQTSEKEKSAGIFEQLVMKITHIGSSNATKKGQGSKQAQRNAQKAVKEAEKEQKGKDKQTENTTNKSRKNTSSGDKQQADNTSKESSETKSDNTASSTTSNATDSGKNKTTEQKTTQGNVQVTTEKNTVQSTTEIPDDMVSCTISISCSILLEHMDDLAENKRKVVPKDGVILGTTTVLVKKGSSVFDVLQKVTKENKIQLEYNYTPAYKNYYIEGIGNLYEFDGGELSGWMYCVNEEFSGMGCSSYTVKDGDDIRWMYTCNLGKDVGDYFEKK